MDQRIINLYDEYTHKPLSRQEFLSRLTALVGSTAGAMAILPMIEVNYTHASVTPDEDLFIETISYPGVPGTMSAYVARPKEVKKYPTVIIIHENRGLNAHIEDVARRAAHAGYLAIAPNALSALGKTYANEDDTRNGFRELKNEDNLANFIKACEIAKSRNDSNGSFGCVGFCWGGAMANSLAVAVPDLKAAVAFYGRQPTAENVPKIKAALQLHYGALDEGVNAGIPAYEAALKENHIDYELYMYEGAQHAFHNDTAPTRYNEGAAKLAWQRTLDFWGKYLK
ncbi:MAG: dienelactone hydrolase family protein [Saprospiraceae bacterium]